MFEQLQSLIEELTRPRLSIPQRVSVYRQLAAYIGAGLPIRQALDTQLRVTAVSEGGRGRAVETRVLENWLVRISEGEKLSGAMNDVASDIELSVVEANEQTGEIANGLERAADMAERTGRFTKIFLQLLYPVFLLIGLLGFLVFVSYAFVPNFSVLYPQEEWYGLAFLFALIADYAPVLVLVLAVLFFGGTGVLVVLLRSGVGPWRVWADRKLAPFKIYRLMIGAASLQSLASLVNAGVPMPEATMLLRDVVNNRYTVDRLDRIAAGLMEGKNFGEAARDAGQGWPDPSFIVELTVFAELGRYDKFSELSDSWVETAEGRVQGIVNTVRGIMLLLFFLVIGFSMVAGIELQRQVQDYLRVQVL